jgi:hypothetical protein
MLEHTKEEEPMGKAADKSDLVSFRELLVANSIQVDALTQLLIEEGLISEERFYAKFKEVQHQYLNRGNA